MNAALKAGKRDQMKAWQAKWMAANKQKQVSNDDINLTSFLTLSILYYQAIEGAVASGQLSEEEYGQILQR